MNKTAENANIFTEENEYTYKHKFMSYISLGISKINACERFDSRYDAKVAGTKIIDEYYERAIGFITCDAGHCIAKKAAKEYAAIIHKKHHSSDTDQSTLSIKKTESDLIRLFEEELKENPGIYCMHCKNRYSDMFSVEKHNFHVETGNTFLDIIAEIIGIDRDYTLSNILEALIEMESDINNLAEIFFESAYKIYQEYCNRNHTAIDEINTRIN